MEETAVQAEMGIISFLQALAVLEVMEVMEELKGQLALVC
jgi:hypothetical protein